MNPELELKKLGFSDKEAKVYLALLELGSGSVQAASQKSAVNRATTYVILEALMKRGVVSTVEKGKKTHYAAENPTTLLRAFRVQEKDIQEKEEEFKAALPELEALFNLSGEKPRVRYFEGKEGLKAIQEDFLRSEMKEFIEIYNGDELEKVFTVAERDRYAKRIQEEGIRTRAIYTRSAGPWTTTFGEQKFVSKDQFPFSSGITIYGSRVAMATLQGKLLGVIIESKEISDTLRFAFELAWLGAKNLQ